MGWYRVCKLEQPSDLSELRCPENSPSLWSCGGLQGIEVHYQGKCFKIPRARILSLMCDEIRIGQVSRWENMPDEQVIKKLIGMNYRTPEKEIEMTDEQQAELAKINNLTQVEMARLKRFAPVGHPYFDRRLPYFAAFEARFRDLGGMTPEISKAIGH